MGDHLSLPASKYPTMSLLSGAQLLSHGHAFVCYVLPVVSPHVVVGTCLWSYICVNVMGCHVPLCLFLAGSVVTFYLWFGVSPLRGSESSRRVQTLKLKFLPTDSNHFFIGTNMVSTTF